MRMFMLPLAALLVAAAPAAPPLRCPLDAPYDVDNAFAHILRGDRQASVVLETDAVIAFVPLAWAHPGHVLVVPKRAVRHLDDMSEAEVIAVIAAVKRVAAAQRAAFGATGYTLEQNNARHQSVCHAHFHVIPDTPEAAMAPHSRAKMNAVAARLRAALPPA